MSDETVPAPQLEHRSVNAAGLSLHVVEAGAPEAPVALLLHGWPESWAAFERVMPVLAGRAHVIAIDLPGIGASQSVPAANDKRTLARYLRALIDALSLQTVTLVGHDVGGQIVYAYLREYPGTLARAVLMNIAIPGIEPWPQVIANPRIWHFGFHAVGELPEKLVTGRERAYFDFFYNVLSARRDGVSERARQAYVTAYARPEALRTGFDWYRAFAQDEKDNEATRGKAVDTPVLYMRGEKEQGDIERYLAGLRGAGLRDIRGRTIPGSGHFAPDEQPAEVARAIAEFMEP